MNTTSVAAVDLGATSGRVIVGRVGKGRLELRHVARFPNTPVQLPDGLHWNIVELYRQVLDGLATAQRDEPNALASVGIDAWAVDYGLLSGDRLLGLPYHYRDGRSERGVAAVHHRVGPAELYRQNGLQHLPFNTVFQLACDQDLFQLADRMLLIPDLLTFWLTGAKVAERTNASTTGLLSPASGYWNTGLMDRLGLPTRILPDLVDPGARVGALSGDAASVVGSRLPVTSVGSHDTASAVVAVPATSRDFAYISCGTWGLVGLELDAPVISEDARTAGFTNEGGVDGRIRFLHNVMGLWLLSESIRSWERAATAEQRSSSLQELLAEAASVSGPVPVFDVDDERFLPPGDIPARIADWCREHEVRPPTTPAEYVRSIIESLAQAFAESVARAARLARRPVSLIHIVGGGAQNTLLCQATANRSGLPVHAGPVEATAIGNILIQARSVGALDGDLESLRLLIADSSAPTTYLPR